MSDKRGNSIANIIEFNKCNLENQFTDAYYQLSITIEFCETTLTKT